MNPSLLWFAGFFKERDTTLLPGKNYGMWMTKTEVDILNPKIPFPFETILLLKSSKDFRTGP